MVVLGLLGGAFLLLTNGFFVTTEFSLTRVRQFSSEEFRGAGLDRAWSMTDELELSASRPVSVVPLIPNQPATQDPSPDRHMNDPPGLAGVRGRAQHRGRVLDVPSRHPLGRERL
jgi:hypothetical protein